MHTPEFGAAAQLRKHFSGIEQAGVVEGAFQPLLLGEIDLVEHHVHQVALFHAYAMLAGQHAADLDAQPQDVVRRIPPPARVRRDCWRQTGSADADCRRRHETHWRRASRISPPTASSAPAPRRSAARNRAVHAQIVGRNAPHRGKRRLAAGPEQQPLLPPTGSRGRWWRHARSRFFSTQATR